LAFYLFSSIEAADSATLLGSTSECSNAGSIEVKTGTGSTENMVNLKVREELFTDYLLNSLLQANYSHQKDVETKKG
jgi:hypothetical protein